MKKREHLVSALPPRHLSVIMSSISTITLWKDLVWPILWLRRQVQRFEITRAAPEWQSRDSSQALWTPDLVPFAPHSAASNVASGLTLGHEEESQYHSQKQGRCWGESTGAGTGMISLSGVR